MASWARVIGDSPTARSPAIDFASWAVDNAALAGLNALDAHAYADSFNDS